MFLLFFEKSFILFFRSFSLLITFLVKSLADLVKVLEV